MFEISDDELSYMSDDEENFRNKTIASCPVVEEKARRSEEKPRVYENRCKRYWNRYYGRLENERRIEKKKKMKEMKEGVEDDGESTLTKAVKSRRKKNQNKILLNRLHQIDISNDIKDTIHDYNIISGNDKEMTNSTSYYSNNGSETVQLPMRYGQLQQKYRFVVI